MFAVDTGQTETLPSGGAAGAVKDRNRMLTGFGAGPELGKESRNAAAVLVIRPALCCSCPAVKLQLLLNVASV